MVSHIKCSPVVVFWGFLIVSELHKRNLASVIEKEKKLFQLQIYLYFVGFIFQKKKFWHYEGSSCTLFLMINISRTISEFIKIISQTWNERN